MSILKEEHFIGKVTQKALITKGDLVLIARDVDDASIWELPGGRLNLDEVPAAGLRREIFEELGVRVSVGDIIYTEQFHHTRDNIQGLLLVYRVTLPDEHADFTLASDEVAEVKWISKSELDNQTIYDDCYRALVDHFDKA